MGGTQPVVAEAPPVVAEHPSAGNGDYSAANSTASTDGSTFNTAVPVPPEVPECGVYAVDGSGYDHVNAAYNNDPNSSAEGVPVYTSYPEQANVAAPAGENIVGHGYVAGESVPPAGCESVNGGANEPTNSAAAGTAENGALTNESGGAEADQQFGDASEMSSEEDRLWVVVRANCLDFNAWTALIQESEKENNILKIRKVYDAFLAEFPLCYGYWKKYADHEGRLDSIEKVMEVYERAVLAVTYSVDIWVHYCQFVIATHGDPDNIRRLFERGLAYVGTDYLSYPLWDEYITYEYTLQEFSRVAMIYTRILEHPIQQLDRYFNSFKEFAASRPLVEIRTAEEAALLTATEESTDQGHEGEVRLDDTQQSYKSFSATSTEAEELEKHIAVREEMYKKAKELDSKIINFETAIRRPYFHVKPLDDPELENWHNYLDFIERGDDFNKVVKLYERCLIACANYPEYWIRYVLCMEASGSMELANNALARATQVFVKKQPDIHLFAARFKELSGDVLGARAEYQLLFSEFSTALLEATVRHANMEYRLGNKDAAFSIFEEAIATEVAKEISYILPLMFVQYSRFSFLVAGNAEKARDILTGALERVQPSRLFLEALIHMESVMQLPKRVDYLDSVVEKFITPSPDNSSTISAADREDISSIFLEFLDIFGDARSIKKADNRHSMLFLRHRSTLASRKRCAEDYLGSDKTKVSKTYTTDPSTGQSVMGAYPTAQNQWPAGYGQNPPAWPQVSQVQGQQWNSGYAPQAGYSGYGGYGAYQQMPASAPQAASHAAYPTASSAQAYPQQNYTQPSATYAQQPVAAGQAYYGSYYS